MSFCHLQQLCCLGMHPSGDSAACRPASRVFSSAGMGRRPRRDPGSSSSAGSRAHTCEWFKGCCVRAACSAWQLQPERSKSWLGLRPHLHLTKPRAPACRYHNFLTHAEADHLIGLVSVDGCDSHSGQLNRCILSCSNLTACCLLAAARVCACRPRHTWPSHRCK